MVVNKPFGIGLKMVLSFFFVSLITVTIMGTLFYAAIHQYYVVGMEQALVNTAEASALMYNRHAPPGDLEDKIEYIQANFDINEHALIEVYTPEEKFLLSNMGKSEQAIGLTSDYYVALDGVTGVYVGEGEGRDHIMSVSVPLYDKDLMIGVLRYVSSMEGVYSVLRQNLALYLTIGFVILILATTIGFVMSVRILNPVRDLIGVTRQISNGNLKAKANIYYNDEIGELANAVNHMTEEIQKSDKARTDFISSVSHELRTPLTSIKGWAETIDDNPMDLDTTRLGMEIIGQETNRLIKMVNNLLDFSKLQNHRIELQSSSMWLDAFLEDLYRQFSVRADQEDVVLRLHLDSQDIQIYADESRLRQVLINILDNAFKFVAGRDKPEIIIESHMLDDQVVITVEDNGPGMSSSELLYVKQKFYKGSFSSSGTGLGLSIANEIVALHNGTLYVDSIPGYGTKVSMVLPFYEEGRALEVEKKNQEEELGVFEEENPPVTDGHAIPENVFITEPEEKPDVLLPLPALDSGLEGVCDPGYEGDSDPSSDK